MLSSRSKNVFSKNGNPQIGRWILVKFGGLVILGVTIAILKILGYPLERASYAI